MWHFRLKKMRLNFFFFSFEDVWCKCAVTRLQVRSITVNHTFKIDKARRELGYWPRAYNLVDCVERYQRTRPHRPSRLPVGLPSRPLALLLMSALSLLLLMLLCQIMWWFLKDGCFFFLSFFRWMSVYVWLIKYEGCWKVLNLESDPDVLLT